MEFKILSTYAPEGQLSLAVVDHQVLTHLGLFSAAKGAANRAIVFHYVNVRALLVQIVSSMISFRETGYNLKSQPDGVGPMDQQKLSFDLCATQQQASSRLTVARHLPLPFDLQSL